MSKKRSEGPSKIAKTQPTVAARAWTAAEQKRLQDAVWNHEKNVECPACGGTVLDGGSDSHILRVKCSRCANETSYNFG